jgi:hypothetical protein
MSSGSEKRERFRNLTVRLTLVERAAIDAAADRAGLTISSYVREMLLNGPQPRAVHRPQIERAELAKVLGELGKIGSNINQIAHAANLGDAVPRRRIRLALEELAVMKDALLKALGREP